MPEPPVPVMPRSRIAFAIASCSAIRRSSALGMSVAVMSEPHILRSQHRGLLASRRCAILEGGAKIELVVQLISKLPEAHPKIDGLPHAASGSISVHHCPSLCRSSGGLRTHAAQSLDQRLLLLLLGSLLLWGLNVLPERVKEVHIR